MTTVSATVAAVADNIYFNVATAVDDSLTFEAFVDCLHYILKV